MGESDEEEDVIPETEEDSKIYSFDDTIKKPSLMNAAAHSPTIS
jgi:hypothetical protein